MIILRSYLFFYPLLLVLDLSMCTCTYVFKIGADLNVSLADVDVVTEKKLVQVISSIQDLFD